MSLESASADILKKFEGFGSKAYWDVNHYRIGYGSDTLELPDGTHREVKQGDTTTKELATKDLERRLRTEFIPAAEKKIGKQYWDKLPEQAQAALISFAYNYGSIAKQQVVDAARSGDLKKLSEALVDSTANDNKKLSQGVQNQLKQRRAEEANLIEKAKQYVSSAATYTKKNWKPIALIGVCLVGIAITTIILIDKGAFKK